MNCSRYCPAPCLRQMPTGSRPRLLVVDDEADNIAMLHQMLCADYDIRAVTSGAAMLRYCREQLRPDLVLLDIMMPDMDGLTACRRLLAEEGLCDLPVIFLTASDDPQTEAAALDCGGVDFVSRPINLPVLLARIRTHLKLQAQRMQLVRQALQDGLTGLANRRRFDEALSAEWARSCRSGASLSLIMIDIDHFKAYNDHYGHLKGDECLATVATVLGRAFGRSHDLVARYGGEEFVCLVPESRVSDVCAMASSLCRAVFDLAAEHATAPAGRVTISAGVASQVPLPGEPPSSLLEAADRALYEAKRGGRNRACCHHGEAVPSGVVASMT